MGRGNPRQGKRGPQHGDAGTPRMGCGDSSIELGDPQKGMRGPPAWGVGTADRESGDPGMRHRDPWQGMQGPTAWDVGTPSGDAGTPGTVTPVRESRDTSMRHRDPRQGTQGPPAGKAGTPSGDAGTPGMGYRDPVRGCRDPVRGCGDPVRGCGDPQQPVGTGWEQGGVLRTPAVGSDLSVPQTRRAQGCSCRLPVPLLPGVTAAPGPRRPSAGPPLSSGAVVLPGGSAALPPAGPSPLEDSALPACGISAAEEGLQLLSAAGVSRCHWVWPSSGFGWELRRTSQLGCLRVDGDKGPAPRKGPGTWRRGAGCRSRAGVGAGGPPRGWMWHKPERCRSLTPWECCGACQGCRRPGLPARCQRHVCRAPSPRFGARRAHAAAEAPRPAPRFLHHQKRAGRRGCPRHHGSSSVPDHGGGRGAARLLPEPGRAAGGAASVGSPRRGWSPAC